MSWRTICTLYFLLEMKDQSIMLDSVSCPANTKLKNQRVEGVLFNDYSAPVVNWRPNMKTAHYSELLQALSEKK
jgi:hypothetical protein